jgi:hypothetical protein
MKSEVYSSQHTPSGPTRSAGRGARAAFTLAVVILLIGGVLIVFARYGKSHEQTLEEFAGELPGASWPSPAARRYVATVDEKLTADEKLAILYRRLRQRWRYAQDPPGEDHFADAAATLSDPIPKGDCDDFAAAMVSVCKVLGIPHRVWLGQSEAQGHVWLEVLITPKPDLRPAIRERLLLLFQSSAQIIHRPDGYWLQLSTPSSLAGFTPTHFVDPTGRLHPAAELDSANRLTQTR